MNEILPKWLRKDIPEVSACGLVGYDDIEDIFWVKENGKTSLSFYNSMNAVMEEFGMDCCNLSIHESMKSRYKVINNCLVNSSYSEVFFVKNDNLQFDSLQKDFKQWQDFYKRVEFNDDWRAAYHLVETLPILWKPVSAVPTFLWNRNDGHSYVDETVIDDSVILDLYIPDEELSLSVSEENFEKAYDALGKLIVKTFSIDGSLKRI